MESVIANMWHASANRQQAHIVIGRLHLSKLYSSKSLTTPFVKILHRQTFAPYGIIIITIHIIYVFPSKHQIGSSVPR